jgi:hypothetical protein
VSATPSSTAAAARDLLLGGVGNDRGWWWIGEDRTVSVEKRLYPRHPGV